MRVERIHLGAGGFEEFFTGLAESKPLRTDRIVFTDGDRALSIVGDGPVTIETAKLVVGRQVCLMSDQKIHQLEERVEELERIISRELGYYFGPVEFEPQTVDCECGTSFDVNLVNGCICPDCGTNANAEVVAAGEESDQ